MKVKGIIIIILVALLSVTGLTSYSYFKIKQWNEKILPGVSIEEVKLEGKTKEEAQDLVKQKYSDAVVKKKIIIKTPNKEYTMDYAKINAKYNIQEAIEEAYQYGRETSMFEKYKLINHPDAKQINLKFSYNTKAVDELLKEIQQNTNREPKNAKISMVGSGNFEITPEQTGLQLDASKLKTQLLKALSDGFEGEVLTINAPVKEVAAKVKKAALASIDTEIASFSTNFASSSENRATNVALATKSINGTVLMPGDTFSFNETVGERTADKGYKAAHVIVGDELVDGLGGGICQVSTTLYNTILRTSLNSDQRTHHTLPSGYIPLGQDATVDWGNIDYKFTNTFKYPIYIAGYIHNRNVYFTVYSNHTLKNRTYEIVNDVYEVLQPETKTVEDPTKPEGYKEVVKQAYTGYKVKVYRNIYENGKLVKKELISNDTYAPVNGLTKIGTQKAKPTTAPTPKTPAPAVPAPATTPAAENTQAN